MALKAIRSKDPRKAALAAAIKKHSGAPAVTMMNEDTVTGLVVANALRKESRRRGCRVPGQDFGWVVVRADGSHFTTFDLGSGVLGWDNALKAAALMLERSCDDAERERCAAANAAVTR